MKRFRLSLNKDRCNEACATNNVLIISDDESFDSLPNARENVQREKYSRITSREITNVSNNMAHIPSLESGTTSSSQQQQQHILDLSDDESDDADVAIINEFKTSNKRQSMFNWNKKWPENSLCFNDNTPHSSRFNEQPREEICNKRQKLMDKTMSSNDDLVNNLEDFEREVSPPQVTIQHEKMIGGVKVKFPVNPYSCQITIMSSIIMGCNKERNCLLESPTGSGKTLALLCGALAWQEQYSEQIYKENSEMDIESSSCTDDNSVEENFFLNLTQCCDDDSLDNDRKTCKPRKVPKIFYCTRTHKQIEQVVRELKKTAYRHKRMTVLSSREHSCIQHTQRNKTELCNELLDPKKSAKCPYYNEKNKKTISSFNALQMYGLETPWDIEDLVSLGRDVAACPYFAARTLMTEADIIFCPYNYVIDPNIRESMQINLKDNVVILDEAHNIEDICRDVASVNLRDDDLHNAAKECKHLSYDPVRSCTIAYYSTIQNYLADIAECLKHIANDNDNWEKKSNDYWHGSQFLQILNVHKVGHSRFPNFLLASKTAISDFEKMKNESRSDEILSTISRETKTILEHICFVMQILTSETTVDDYRAYVMMTKEPKKHMSTSTGYIPKDTCIVRTMKLICLNPAIIFAPLARTVRSVILASGTLTPMSSFESELGTQFWYKPKLQHVVSEKQMYIRHISRGPTGKSLLAKYGAVNSFDFQDELGRLVLQVCDAVPYGVLCFFSSYIVMNTILARWRNIEIWKKLSALKQIFVEPQSNSDLLALMKEYREVIKKSSSISFREPSGAIFFAVFRGKVAEGIDFRDNEARCVLAIGIPYNNNKDTTVSMKIKYNDDNQSKGLLKGSEWYTVNAFRALNQALGRCIRHKDDWGAVLLVDERFQKQNNINHLPKWVKSMGLENTIYNLRIELEDFVALQIARERGKEYIDRKNTCNRVQE